MNKVKVYRSGVVAPPERRGCEAGVYTSVDELRPAGHPERTHGIFAVPQIEGVARWVRGNALVGSSDIAVREVTVDADSVMVYSVRAWEYVSAVYNCGNEDEFLRRVAEYFEQSMTLTQWLMSNEDASEWEVIFPSSSVIGVRAVSAKRVASAVDDSYIAADVMALLKNKR